MVLKKLSELTHDDGKHTGSAKRGAVNGVCGLNAWGQPMDSSGNPMAYDADLTTHQGDTSTHGVATVADAADLTTHEAADTGVHGAGSDVLATDADILAQHLYPSYYRTMEFGGTVIQGTWGMMNYTDQLYAGCFTNNSHAINDEYNWLNVKLQKGTYKISVLGFHGSNRGITTFTYNGNTILTFDGYNAANTVNQYHSDTFVLASNTSATIEMKILSKNASSTGYYGTASYIIIERTA